MTGEWPPPSWALIQQVPCPHCGVRAGWSCVRPGTARPSDFPHAARRDLAADEGVYVP